MDIFLKNLLSERLLKKTKDVIFGSRQARTVISRRIVIAIRTRVVKANNPGKAFVSLTLKLDHFSVCGTQQRTAHCFKVKKKILAIQKKAFSRR